MLRLKRKHAHDSLDTRVRDLAQKAAPKPQISRESKSLQETAQPPAKYPDATWDPQRKMWTVVRNGRLMGVK